MCHLTVCYHHFKSQSFDVDTLFCTCRSCNLNLWKFKALLKFISPHTHNHFTALWTLSGTPGVNWYQKVHFAILWIFWSKMKITQADTPTIQMDCHTIQTNWCPISAIPTIFTPDALPGTTLPIYPGLGHSPSMLACIPGDLV